MRRRVEKTAEAPASEAPAAAAAAEPDIESDEFSIEEDI